MYLTQTAEQLFNDNVNYGRFNCKAAAMPKLRGVIRLVTPKIVMKKLKELGITTTNTTLWRYVKDGLIPEPDTKGAGQGRGKDTDYPEDTPQQFTASYLLRHNKDPYLGKHNKEQTRKAREAALRAMSESERKNVEVEKLIRNILVREVKEVPEELRGRALSRMEDAAVFWYYIYKEPERFISKDE